MKENYKRRISITIDEEIYQKLVENKFIKYSTLINEFLKELLIYELNNIDPKNFDTYNKASAEYKKAVLEKIKLNLKLEQLRKIKENLVYDNR